jgi:glutamate synthase (NADPH/NADH) small chain
LAGVHQALPFLIKHNSPMALESPAIEVAQQRVVVLGGGDTAMDCLRTAVRAGAAETVCVYRRDLVNMPGSRKEYYNAIEEGAQFLFLTNPVALEANGSGRVAGVRCSGWNWANRISQDAANRAWCRVRSSPSRRT